MTTQVEIGLILHAIFTHSASSFTLYWSNSLDCMSVQLVLDGWVFCTSVQLVLDGWVFCMNGICTLIAAWENSSQRSQETAKLIRSASRKI